MTPVLFNIIFLLKTCIWLQKCCAAPCPKLSLSAPAGHPFLYHGPAVTPAYACQLGRINAVGILQGSISSLALNILKKIQRKCKARSLHGSTLDFGNRGDT